MFIWALLIYHPSVEFRFVVLFTFYFKGTIINYISVVLAMMICFVWSLHLFYVQRILLLYVFLFLRTSLSIIYLRTSVDVFQYRFCILQISYIVFMVLMYLSYKGAVCKIVTFLSIVFLVFLYRSLNFFIWFAILLFWWSKNKDAFYLLVCVTLHMDMCKQVKVCECECRENSLSACS